MVRVRGYILLGFWSQWVFSFVQAGGPKAGGGGEGNGVMMLKVLPTGVIQTCASLRVCFCARTFAPVGTHTRGGKGKVITDDIGPKGGN